MVDKKVKELGKKDFFELKKDQQNTIKGTVAKVKKDVSILPKNYITKPVRNKIKNNLRKKIK